jgi:hypothetical protein
MELSEKYVNESEKLLPENKDKKILSDDAFAVCEFIELLINKIEHTRRSLIK